MAASKKGFLVGGYALAFHGAPRFTEGIDFFILISPENAVRMTRVIERFGFGGLELDRGDFLKPEYVIQLGMLFKSVGNW